MEVTLNQLNKELEAIATAYAGYGVINSYFWGSPFDAISRDAVEYPLMVATLQPSNLTTNQVTINIAITLADKHAEDNYDDINNIHSDLLRICTDIRALMRTKRWKDLVEFVQDVPIEPFINKGPDITAGWVARLTFRIDDLRNYCAAPLKDYDYENPINVDPACADADYTVQYVNGTLIESGSIESGGNATINVPNPVVCSDGTVNVQKSDATLIAAVTVASGGASAYPVADSVVSNSDDSYTANVKATEPLEIPDEAITLNGGAFLTKPSKKDQDIVLQDQSAVPIVPDSVVGNVITVDTGVTPVGATLMKTGQTVSFRTGDDGDVEAGRATSFFILGTANPFGNTNRFTDEFGGQTYTLNIVIDWSTFDAVAGTVLGWRRTHNGVAINWNDAIDQALAVSIGTFVAGWRLPNANELLSLFCWNAASLANPSSQFSYPPFYATLVNVNTFWTSTSLPAATTNAMWSGSAHQLTYAAKTTTAPLRFIPCRAFTVVGTTLS